MLRSIQTGSAGFGFRFDVEPQNLMVNLEGLGRASVEYETPTGLRIMTSVSIGERGAVIQSSKIISTDSLAIECRYTLDLGISVNRASYGQLTEGGPILLPKSENTIRQLDHGFAVSNRHLGAHLRGYAEKDGKEIEIGAGLLTETFEDSPVKCAISRTIRIPPKSTVAFTAIFYLLPELRYDSSWKQSVCSKDTGLSAIWPKPESPGRFIVRRNLEYILGNCALPLRAKNAVCIVTDHVALPLGWMRDN